MKAMNKAGQSEALFIVKAFEKGWEIAQPFHHSQPYDFIIRKDGKWQTVQVKTAWLDKRSHKVEVRLQRSNGSYQEGDFDLLAIIYEKQIWLIDWESIKHISSKIMKGIKRVNIKHIERPIIVETKEELIEILNKKHNLEIKVILGIYKDTEKIGWYYVFYK